MIFESRNANIILFFSISTVILWNGPSRLVSGYKDSLPVAKTRQGLARGETWVSRDSLPFTVFRGIPYAKPPVGDRRFRRTEPLDMEDSWEGLRDFNRELVRCHQVDQVLGIYVGQEDCLRLNVYTPELSPEVPLPVIVYIHGGGFVSGEAGAGYLGPHFLMDEGVVVVTLHYRLGILGFLSLETEEIPGNQGLWDQRMALIWVKQNIKHFGGDPSKVTLAGTSAGSMSVNYHLVSPQSRGLFQSVLMMSGTAISPYTRLASTPSSYGLRLGEALGCGGEGEDISSCLKSLPINRLYEHVLFDECSVRRDLGLTFPGPWVPSIDQKLSQPFLPRDPEASLKEGLETKVPVMLGLTKEEGLLYSTRFLKEPSFLTWFLSSWSSCGPSSLLGLEGWQVTPEEEDQASRLLQAYTGGQETSLQEWTDLFTDAVFARDTNRLSSYLVKNGNKEVFKYIFAYKGTSSLAEVLFYPFWKLAIYMMSRLIYLPWLSPSEGLGTCHGDDLFYLFQLTPIIDLIPSQLDRNVSRNLVRTVANFAKTGNPKWRGWEPAGVGLENPYHVIGQEGGMKEADAELMERLKRWQ